MIENRQQNSNPVIGDIYLMKFDGTGNEQCGWRPGVVFQNNVGNTHSPNIIALPLTSAVKRNYQPTHVKIYAENTGLHKDSYVLCENPERMSKEKLGRFITRLSDEYMRQIATANILATAAISFLTEEELVAAHKMSLRLNKIA